MKSGMEVGAYSVMSHDYLDNVLALKLPLP
jgi:hypothetical protein